MKKFIAILLTIATLALATACEHANTTINNNTTPNVHTQSTPTDNTITNSIDDDILEWDVNEFTIVGEDGDNIPKMQYNDMKMDSQGNVYIAYITSEETFSLAKKGENGFSVLASGAVSESILDIGSLTQTEEEKDKLYLPEPVNIMFDSHDVPYVMGYLDECMVVYKYDENAKALVQVSKHELSYKEGEEVYSHKNLQENFTVDEHFNAYFTVLHAPLIKTEISIDTDDSRVVLELIKYDVENNKFTSCFFDDVKNYCKLICTSEDGIVYICGSKIFPNGSVESAMELHTFEFLDNGSVIHKNVQTLAYSDVSDISAGAIDMWLDENNNIYVYYNYNENFGMKTSKYIAIISNREIIDTKPFNKYLIDSKKRPLAYPSNQRFYNENGQVYFFEICNDKRNDIYIGKMDFSTGEITKLREILLPEKYMPYSFDIISDGNGGYHIAYLLESYKGICYFHLN